MKTDRRGLFRLLAGALTAASDAAAAERPLAIHAETGNTRFGALGVRLRSLRDPLNPFKPYPGARRVGLPTVEIPSTMSLAETVRRYAPTPGFREDAISLAALSRLLHFTNGVTGRLRAGERDLRLRAAPSAGALYAGEVYVVAERVDGLAPGVYYYAVLDHELVALRSGSFMARVAAALETPAGISRAPAVILLTNVFRRYRHRYANRGYRFALIDLGHIGENLRLAARSAGFGEACALGFHDDALNALLGVDGREESVCVVHAIGLPSKAAVGALRALGELQRVDPAAVPSRGGAPDRYHQATKLIPAPTARPAPRPWAPPDRAASGVVLKRARANPSAAVEETIRTRRSASVFHSQPLALGDLAFVLEMARGHDLLRRTPGIEIHLIAHGVRDLAPGLYRYEPEVPRLGLVRSGDLRSAMKQACLGQEKAGQAAAGLVMVARLAESVSRIGDRSYRDLLIEAGGIAQRIYLAAEAVGAVARNLAAFLDDEFNALLGLDGRREAAVHLTMLGPGR